METSQPLDCTLRRAQLSDLKSIVELSGQLGYPAELETFRPRLQEILERTDHAIWVAADPAGQILGWLQAYLRLLLVAEAHAALGGIVVRQGARKHGIGRLLMDAAESWAFEKGCARVRVNTNILREDAQHFYPALGYTLHKTQNVYVKRIRPRV